MTKKEARQEPVAQQPKMAFDAWWAVTHKKLPENHHKEIVLADFNARGLSTKESMTTFNKALELYGVKLS